MTFLEEVLVWMKNEHIVEYSYRHDQKPYTVAHHPVEVTNVVAYGSDYADGSTEGGFIGDTEVTIRWKDEAGNAFQTEIKPGDKMASLWTWMIQGWRERSGGDG